MGKCVGTSARRRHEKKIEQSATTGLGVDISAVAKNGFRVIFAVTGSLVVLGSISYALIRIAEIP
jgi:hypothetical protein